MEAEQAGLAERPARLVQKVCTELEPTGWAKVDRISRSIPQEILENMRDATAPTTGHQL